MQALGRSRLLNGKYSSQTVDLPSCRSPACFRQRPTKSRRGGHQRTQATPGADEGEDKNVDKLKEKFFSGEQPTSSGQKQQQQSTEGDQGLELLDGVNPFVLGRKARKQVDAVWGKLTSITSPTKSYVFDDVLESSMDDDWAPKADAATVLVVGATGRVGRILVRKLLLRGYKVRALVRPRDVAREEVVPDAVEVVEGDVGEPRDCEMAVRGVDKVIFAAAARSAFTADLVRVDDKGVMNLVKAMQNEFNRVSKRGGAKYNERSKKELADFSRKYHQLRWDIDFVGVQGDDGRIGRDFDRVNLATAEINEERNLVFEGALFTRGSLAEVGADVAATLPGGGQRLADTEGLTLRLKGDGRAYACVLTTGDGNRYVARFPTRTSFLVVRLPFSLFRPETEGQPPLVPDAVTHIAIRCEQRRPPAAAPAAAATPAGAMAPAGRPQRAPVQSAAASAAAAQRFKLEVDWIKALPGGSEPDFVLLSCPGVGAPGMDPAEVQKVVAAKRRGEEHLRVSGLGYTIIRPGPLVDEPGGYKALVFDQGDRVSQNVSYADVADICLRAIRVPEARNKTFDVCYEYEPDEGLQMYELVASIPGTGGAYLAPALSSLQKNT